MDSHILLFLVDGILGYFLQGMGAVMGIYIASKRRIDAKHLLLMSLAFAGVTYVCRYMSEYIGFGIHSLLMIAGFVIIASTWIKTHIVKNIFAVIGTFIVITIYEALNYMVSSMIFGEEYLRTVLESSDVTNQILRTLIGCPTNVMLLITMFIIYKIVMLRLSMKEHDDGKTGKIDSE